MAVLCCSAPIAHAGPAGVVQGKVSIEGEREGPLVVYIETATTPGTAAAAPGDGAQAVSIAQKNQQFAPGAVVVKQGTTVQFPNEDKIYHNVFSPTPGNEFDLGLYRKGVSKSATMQKPGEIDVFCNIHPGMKAKVLVLQNDWHTEVAADGTYKLPAVPAGSYTLVAWSAQHEPQKKPIEVQDGGSITVDFNLAKRTSTSHLNKHGEQYGRYK